MNIDLKWVVQYFCIDRDVFDSVVIAFRHLELLFGHLKLLHFSEKKY